MLKLLGKFFPGLSLVKLGIYVFIVLGGITAVTATYFGWRHHQRMIGWNNAIEYVKQKNAQAKQAADQVVGDVDRCETDGGSWNVSTGKCDR